MEILRTPDERFAAVTGWFEPTYVTTSDGLRVAVVDEGPRDAPVVLLLHGEPSWSYLWRRVATPLLDAGLRVVAPDLVGFGRSDKPVAVDHHTYARHVEWLRSALLDADGLALHDITLVCQDWGGLLGLRLLAENRDRFARVVAANTGLPDGSFRMPEEWWRFRDFVARTDDLPVGLLVQRGTAKGLSPEVVAAYDAPFPDGSFKAGPKAMPDLIRRRRTTWPPLRRVPPGRCCASTTARSCAPSATATRSPAGPTRCSPGRCLGRRANRTPPSRAPGTSCRRTRARSSAARSSPGSGAD